MAYFAPIQLVTDLIQEHPEAAWIRMEASEGEDACLVQVVDQAGTVVGVAYYAGTMPITRESDAGA